MSMSYIHNPSSNHLYHTDRATMTEVLQPTKLKWGSVQGRALKSSPASVQEPTQEPVQELRCVDDLLKARASTIPDAPIVGYPQIVDGRTSYVYYSPTQIDYFANGAISTLIVNGLAPNVRIPKAHRSPRS